MSLKVNTCLDPTTVSLVSLLVHYNYIYCHTVSFRKGEDLGVLQFVKESLCLLYMYPQKFDTWQNPTVGKLPSMFLNTGSKIYSTPPCL